jgi:hypothetical protein
MIRILGDDNPPYRAGAELVVVGSDSEADHNRGKAIGLCRALDEVARGGAVWIGHALPADTGEFVLLAGNGAQTVFGFSFTEAGDIAVLFTDANGQVLIEQGPGSTQYRGALNVMVPGQPLAMAGSISYAPNGVPIPAGSTLTIVRKAAQT